MKKRRVVILSRESNKPTLDLRLLTDELKSREGIEVVVLCKMLRHNYFSYFAHMLKQIREIRRSDVIIVDTYCIPVSLLRHRTDQTVIQIWHALGAIKQFGWQAAGRAEGRSMTVARIMKMHAGYDRIACCSDVTADFFCEAFRQPKDKIVKLGLPRIDYIKADKSDVRKSILERYPELADGRKNIVYVPTFRKGRGVDVTDLIEAVDTDRYNLVIKLHPLDALWGGQGEAAADQFKKDHVIFDSEFNSYDMLSIADAVISDYSSFVIESTLVNKPLYLYTYDRDEYERDEGLNVRFEEEAIGRYEFRDAAELAAALDEPYDFSALAEFRDRYIDIDTDNCTADMADYVVSLTKNGRQ